MFQRIAKPFRISIHALLAESDLDDILAGVNELLISIHALLAESDGHPADGRGRVQDFYPRSPCGERPDVVPVQHGGKDFYPRSPCGERQGTQLTVADVYKISIHALLAESDLFLRFGPMTRRYFYPRSPCGERPQRTYQQDAKREFLSTLSLRRATELIHKRCKFNRFLSTLSLRRATRQSRSGHNVNRISIHALLAESDSPASVTPAASRNFYPRSPCGERPGQPGG